MEGLKKVHFVGVGGVGMGSFASALASYGHEVTGSDGKLYEPMKGVLEKSGIRLLEGFVEANLAQVKPDLVVIGNVVRRDNSEAKAWIQSGVKFLSFPEAVRTFLIQDKTSIVCAGTHGKTTTTSWLSFLLSSLGKNPSYLIGGVPQNLPAGCMLTDAPLCVVEGDEYDSAFFDKGPKFLHYHPTIAIIAAVEFDHADIYRDLDHVKSSFAKLVSLLPGDGLCVARYDDQNVMSLLSNAICPVQTFGVATGAMWRVGKVEEDENGILFEVIYKGRSAGNFRTPLFGDYNLMNLLSGIVAAVNLGIPMESIRPMTEKFFGAKRRQEVLMRAPFLVMDDFAHHPTEVKATLSGVRRRYPTGKLYALFEPRSATARRNVHQGEYAAAFEKADHVLVSSPYRATELTSEERFSADQLVEDLKKQGKTAQVFDNVDSIVDSLATTAVPGDRIVIMSNGEFGKIQGKILSRLG